MREDMTKEQLDGLWADPANWKLGCLYSCKEDPRPIVPRRRKWAGWTTNCAHWYSWPVLASLLLVLAAPIWVASASGVTNQVILIFTAIVSIAVVSIIAHLISRTR